MVSDVQFEMAGLKGLHQSWSPAVKGILFALIGICLLMSFSCTPVPPGRVEPSAGRSESEKDFDPLAQDDDRAIVITSEQDESGAAMAPADQGGQDSVTGDFTGPERPGIVRGYRVQVSLSDDLREASRVMAEARERFEQEVYLEYDAPYYKVRVGDCSTERQGEELLQIARRIGYPDAWLVRTIISLNDEQEPAAEDR